MFVPRKGVCPVCFAMQINRVVDLLQVHLSTSVHDNAALRGKIL